MALDQAETESIVANKDSRYHGFSNDHKAPPRYCGTVLPGGLRCAGESPPLTGQYLGRLTGAGPMPSTLEDSRKRYHYILRPELYALAGQGRRQHCIQSKVDGIGGWPVGELYLSQRAGQCRDGVVCRLVRAMLPQSGDVHADGTAGLACRRTKPRRYGGVSWRTKP